MNNEKRRKFLNCKDVVENEVCKLCGCMVNPEDYIIYNGDYYCTCCFVAVDFIPDIKRINKILRAGIEALNLDLRCLND